MTAAAGPCARAGAPDLAWHWLGRAGYAAVVDAMEARRGRVLAGDVGAEALLLCEHPPVVTLGRGAALAHVVAAPAELARGGVEVVRSSRGGDVTYHGPGQLMIYPVVRLERGVVAHLERLAGALAILAGELGVPGAAWRRQPAGLWLGESKLAACGLHVRRGVAIHGFALDLSTPAAAWQLIVPCGLVGAAPVSIARASGRAPEAAARVAPRAAALVAAALGRLAAGR